MMWVFPPVPPNYPEDKIKKGDTVRVKMQVPFNSGRRGIAEEVNEQGITVRFNDNSKLTYDEDDLYVSND